MANSSCKCQKMWARFALLLMVFSAVGCRLWPWRGGLESEPSPVVFQAPPTLEEIVNIINSNSAPLRRLQAETASISLPGLPSLKANLSIERPRNFRLKAQLLGPELDVGSNDDLFWFWAKQDPQSAIYYARHDEFAQSRLRQQLPVDPTWVMEALGVVSIDPSMRLEGPIPAGPDRVEIRAKVPSPEGELTKIYVVHARYGWILEQHLIGTQGQLLATARGSRHRYYPVERISLPQQVQLVVPQAQLQLTIQVSGYQINNDDGDPNQLWALPLIPGYQAVNLGGQDLRFSTPLPRSSAVLPYERTTKQPRPPVRGFETKWR